MRRTITAQGQRYLADLQSQVEEGLSVSGVLLGKTLGAGPAQSARFAGTSADLVGLAARAPGCPGQVDPSSEVRSSRTVESSGHAIKPQAHL
jgi:hypothetical protein